MPPSVPSGVRTRRAHPALPLTGRICGAASFWGGAAASGGAAVLLGGALRAVRARQVQGELLRAHQKPRLRKPRREKGAERPRTRGADVEGERGGGCWPPGRSGGSRSCCRPRSWRAPRSLRGFGASSHPHPPSDFGALPAVAAVPRRRRRRVGSGRGESPRLSFFLLRSQLRGTPGLGRGALVLVVGWHPTPAPQMIPIRAGFCPLPLGPCHGNPEGSLQLLGASSPGLLKRFRADTKKLSCQVLRSGGRKDAAKAKPGGGGRSLILLPAPNSRGGPRSPGAWQQEKGEKPLRTGHGPGTSVFRAPFVRFEANWRKKISRQAGEVPAPAAALSLPSWLLLRLRVRAAEGGTHRGACCCSWEHGGAEQVSLFTFFFGLFLEPAGCNLGWLRLAPVVPSPIVADKEQNEAGGVLSQLLVG